MIKSPFNVRKIRFIYFLPLSLTFVFFYKKLSVFQSISIYIKLKKKWKDWAELSDDEEETEQPETKKQEPVEEDSKAKSKSPYLQKEKEGDYNGNAYQGHKKKHDIDRNFKIYFQQGFKCFAY